MKSAVVWPMSTPSGRSAVLLAALFDGGALLRRTAGSAHGDPLRLDDVGRLGRAIALVLQAAARVARALERGGIALLLIGAMSLSALPAPQHAPRVPAKAVRYTGPRS